MPWFALTKQLWHLWPKYVRRRSATFSARLRRERKADEKVERFNRMMDLCAAADDLHGSERIFQRLVCLDCDLFFCSFVYV